MVLVDPPQGIDDLAAERGGRIAEHDVCNVERKRLLLDREADAR